MDDVYHVVMGYETPDMDDMYEALVGPDGFEVVLTEPEDRTFGRDLRKLVELVNSQHEEIKRLRGE